MSDRNQEFARVTFDLPRQDLPELMAYLGGFALDHDFALNVEKPPIEKNEQNSLAEYNRFNPSLVTFLPDGDSQNLVPVLTINNLDEFSLKIGRGKGFGARIAHALGNKANHNPSLRAMLYTQSYFTEGYYSVIGIRAEHLESLVRLLDSGEIYAQKIGKGSISVLAEYYKELLKDE